MIKANPLLLVKIAKNYEGIGVPLLDLISEGNIARCGQSKGSTPLSRNDAVARRPLLVKACGRMIKLSKSSDESAHQTVTEFIKLQTPHETIQIGFTDQKVSGRAGLLTFADFLQVMASIITEDYE